MPFFNWDAKDGEPVLNSHFYVFWAINIPFSMLIFLLLILWLQFQGRYRLKIKLSDHAHNVPLDP
jgi:hypothetical protein